MKPRAVWNDAFLVCHEIYEAARELVNSRVPTTQLTSASKFLWRPDLRPRLVEYVADFARCGERALGETCAGSATFRGCANLHRHNPAEAQSFCHPDSAGSLNDVRHLHAAGQASGGQEICFAEKSKEKADSWGKHRPRNDSFGRVSASSFGARRAPRASRLILFRMYYLGGAEYEAARHLLGLSERTWSDWAEEVRQRVGAELVRARMYPPARYFREMTAPAADSDSTQHAGAASTNGPRAEKMTAAACDENCEQNFT